MAPEQVDNNEIETVMNVVAGIEDISDQEKLAHLITVVRHIADRWGLDYHQAERYSYTLYLEDKSGFLRGHGPTIG